MVVGTSEYSGGGSEGTGDESTLARRSGGGRGGNGSSDESGGGKGGRGRSRCLALLRGER